MEYLILWGFFAIIAGVIAANKNRSAVGWFCLGLLFRPFAWAVALLPVLPANAEEDYQVSGNLRPCPECAELIQPSARKCRYCGSVIGPISLTETDTQPAFIQRTLFKKKK
jgi:hypothetical protein